MGLHKNLKDKHKNIYFYLNHQHFEIISAECLINLFVRNLRCLSDVYLNKVSKYEVFLKSGMFSFPFLFQSSNKIYIIR